MAQLEKMRSPRHTNKTKEWQAMGVLQATMTRFAFSTPLALGTASYRRLTCTRRNRFETMTMTKKPVSEKGKLLFAKAGPDGKSLGDCPFTQKANLALRFNGMEFDVCCVDVSNKPEWFLELTEAGTTPAFQCGDDVLEDSEQIVRLSDELGTSDSKLIRPQEPLWNECEQAVNKIFKPFVAFIKNKDDANEEAVKQDLSDAISELDAVLSKTKGKYLLGDTVSSLDCNLAPKLQHIMVAGKHYKGYDVASVSPRVSEYMDHMRATEEWKPTACADETIVWGWSKFFK